MLRLFKPLDFCIDSFDDFFCVHAGYYIAVQITTPKKKTVRKLQHVIDRTKRDYLRDVERLTQKRASQDEIQGVLQNAAFETDLAQEQIQIILNARLFHEAGNAARLQMAWTFQLIGLVSQVRVSQVRTRISGSGPIADKFICPLKVKQSCETAFEKRGKSAGRRGP